MATRKTAGKTSQKVTVDLNVDKPSKKTSKKIGKQLKKVSPLTLFLAVVLLVVGAVGGFFGFKYLMKNDCFELIGKDEITLTLDETYIDEGVKVIAFGKDDSDKVEIETNLTRNEDGSYSATNKEEGTYYIIYRVSNLKYGTIFKVQKIRLVNFVESAELEEIENAQQEVINE